MLKLNRNEIKIMCWISKREMPYSTGVAPIEFGTPLDPNLDQDTVQKVLKHENHPSIIESKKLAKTNERCIFPKAKTEDINKIINSLNP